MPAKIIPIVWLLLPDGVDVFVLSGYLIGKMMFKSFVADKNTTTALKKF